MGWLGKVVGGVIGFAAGGPVGAVIGVGVGHGVDWLAGNPKRQRSAIDSPAESARVLDLNVDAEYLDDDAGRLCEFHIRSPIPDSSQGFVQFLDATGTPVKGEAPFIAGNGDFFAAAPIFDGMCRIYVPFGALNHSSAGKYGLLLTALHAPPGSANFTIIGATAFKVALPAPRRWSKVEWLSPLIDLCMSVVHADGRVLPEEVRVVKTYFGEVFELNSREMKDLKAAMKHGPHPRLDEVVSTVTTRLPGLGVTEILAVLADVSACDGDIHPNEVELIHRIAIEMGAASQWDRIARELGLAGRTATSPIEIGSPSVDDAYQTLGLEPGVSRAEVQAAYRKLASDYHPDRVLNLPQEFQEIAHDKMAKINAAYEIIRNR